MSVKVDFKEIIAYDFSNLEIEETSVDNCYGTCNEYSCDTTCDCVCNASW